MPKLTHDEWMALPPFSPAAKCQRCAGYKTRVMWTGAKSRGHVCRDCGYVFRSVGADLLAAAGESVECYDTEVETPRETIPAGMVRRTVVHRKRRPKR